ncbi:UNVERIFIED_ORG: hypothetical protein J2W19_003204 [Shinella zoogloeoides]|nr:hypothetical protein [Shinella zoogloeoides]
MNAEQLHILQHSLGLDPCGRGTMYRNSFVTGAGSTDHPACMALVAKGFMTRRAKVQLYGGDDIFTVTDAGKRAVVAEGPKAPANLASGTSPIRQRGESE